MSLDLKSLWLIYEPPVTGAHPVNTRFAESLEPESSYIHLGQEGFSYSQEKGLPPFAERPESERNRALVIHGHGTGQVLEQEVLHDTFHEGSFVREPTSNLAHHYLRATATATWTTFEAPHFRTWEDTNPRNPQARYLCKRLNLPIPEKENFSFDRLVRRMERFQFVGTVANADEWLAELFPRMGIESSPRPGIAEELGANGVTHCGDEPGFREWVDERHPVDRRLFDYFAEKEAENLEWLRTRVAIP